MTNIRKLSELIDWVDTRNKGVISTNLLGINIEKYFMPSVANIIGTDLSSYKLISKNQFACNPMHVGRDEKMPIALYMEEEPSIVSPAYFVFQVKDLTVLNPEFLMLWFRRAEFDRECWFHTDGSVRGGITWDEILDMSVPVPSIEEQNKIVSSYNDIEKRIKLKRQINDNLEAQVSALFYSITCGKQPNNIFSEIASIESGKRPNTTEQGEYPLVGAGGIMGFINSYNYIEKILVTGRVGTHGVIQRFNDKCWASDNTLVIKSIRYEYSYQFLKKVDFSSLNRGSTQPLITQTDLKNLPIYLPDDETINTFEVKAEKIMLLYEKNLKEISRLEQLQKILVSSLAKN